MAEEDVPAMDQKEIEERQRKKREEEEAARRAREAEEEEEEDDDDDDSEEDEDGDEEGSDDDQWAVDWPYPHEEFISHCHIHYLLRTISSMKDRQGVWIKRKY